VGLQESHSNSKDTSRARSEETAGTTVRTRETYGRRREDSGDIGDKKYGRKIRLQKLRVNPGQCPLDPEHRLLAGSLGIPHISYIISINKDKVPPV
jgi:hypothetical protein